MLLRYTLRDTTEKVDVQADWVEELYYGPIQVKNGYAEVPDHDEFSIMVLCNRGFEIVKDEAPKAEDAEEQGEPEDVVDTPQDEPETEEVDDEPVDEEEQDDEPVADDEQDEAVILTDKELRKMNRADLNQYAASIGMTDHEEAYETKGELVDAILAAQADGSID